MPKKSKSKKGKKRGHIPSLAELRKEGAVKVSGGKKAKGPKAPKKPRVSLRQQGILECLATGGDKSVPAAKLA